MSAETSRWCSYKTRSTWFPKARLTSESSAQQSKSWSIWRWYDGNNNQPNSDWKQRCDENICYSSTTMWYFMICQCWSIFSQIRSRAPRLGMQHEALPNLCKGDKRDNRDNCDYTLSMMVSHISRIRVGHPKPPVGTEILGEKEKTVNKHYSCSKGGSQCGCRVPTPGWKLRQQGWTNSCEYLDDNDKIYYWCATRTPHHHLLSRWEARTPSTQASTAFPSGEHPLAAAVKGLSQNHHHHIIPRLHIIISS